MPRSNRALEALRITHSDLLAARQALHDLAMTLNERRIDKDDAPDYTSQDTPATFGTAIERVRRDGRGHRQEAVVRAGSACRGAATEPGAATTGATPSFLNALADSREGLYRQLEQIAAALRRLEPHSPIPFLLERCVKTRCVAIPQLMRAMMSRRAALSDLDRLLGIDEKS